MADRPLTTTGDAGTEDGRAPRLMLVAVMTLSMGLPAFPTVTLSALSPRVIAELGITRASYGAVPSVMFLMAILFSVYAGRVVDRLGPRTVLVGLHLLAGVAVALFAGATTLAALLAGGAVIGLAQAASNPATNSVIARRVRPQAMGTVIGIKQAGVPLIQFSVGAMLAPFGAVFGWRAALLTGFLLIVPGLLAVLRWMPGPEPRDDRPDHAGAREDPPATDGDLGGLRWLLVATFFVAFGLQAGNVYLPLYAFEAGGLSATAAGVLGGTVGLTGMVGRILIGRHLGRDPRPVRLAVMIAGSASVASLGLLLAPRVGTLVLWPAALLFGAAAFSFNVVATTVVIRTVPRSKVGRVSGGLATALFLGFATGPALFGSVVDGTGSYTVAWASVTSACVIATAVSVRRSVRDASERG